MPPEPKYLSLPLTQGMAERFQKEVRKPTLFSFSSSGQVWAASFNKQLYSGASNPWGPRGAGGGGTRLGALRVPLLTCPHLIWAKPAAVTL